MRILFLWQSPISNTDTLGFAKQTSKQKPCFGISNCVLTGTLCDFMCLKWKCLLGSFYGTYNQDALSALSAEPFHNYSSIQSLWHNQKTWVRLCCYNLLENFIILEVFPGQGFSTSQVLKKKQHSWSDVWSLQPWFWARKLKRDC